MFAIMLPVRCNHGRTYRVLLLFADRHNKRASLEVGSRLRGQMADPDVRRNIKQPRWSRDPFKDFEILPSLRKGSGIRNFLKISES